MVKSKGTFIVFEGIDGAGSTTQVDLLFKYLKKKKLPVIKTAEPTKFASGKRIRKILMGEEKVSAKELQILFTEDRKAHLEKEVLPALDAGKFVLSDRYFYSTIAYGSLDLPRKWLVSLCKDFKRPNVAVFVNTDPSVAMKRMKKRKNKEIFEKGKILLKVQKNYLSLAKEAKEMVIVDGNGKKEEVFEQVVKLLNKLKII